MKPFLLALSWLCREHVFTEKWLLAPTLRIGQQWLDNLALQGTHVLNVRIKTIKGMAIDIAGGEIASRGVSFISDTGSLMLVDRILRKLLAGSLSYFLVLRADLNLSKAMSRSIKTLKLAGIEHSQVDPNCFEIGKKGADIKSLFMEYNKLLTEKRLMDYPDILNVAIQVIEQGNAPAIPSNVLVIVPQEIDLTALERRMISAFPSSMVVSVPWDNQPLAVTDEPYPDSSLLQWILTPLEAPKAMGDETVKIFRALGECNEVREVLRRCVRPGMSLDEVELLHTDVGTYVPLIYETVLRMQKWPKIGFSDLPVTFAEGIPARYSRPGRAFSAWIDWIRQGYPQVSLIRMIQDGLVLIDQNFQEWTFSELSLAFQKMAIGHGVENYISQITEIESEFELKSNQEPASWHGSKRMRPVEHSHSRSSEHEQTRTILNFLKKLLEISMWQSLSPPAILDRMENFLKNIARSENELDNYSRLAILDEIREMARSVDEQSDFPIVDLSEWGASLPNEVRVLGSGPRPGCLHVAHVLSGGHSGRKHTFIMGMDDNRFPGAGINDPLLLDGERAKLSQNLPTASTQIHRKLCDFAGLLSRLSGAVTLSFSCLDIADDRPMFPSPVVFSAYRIISNNKTGDYADLIKWLPQPASFSPSAPDQCLDMTEWWHARLGQHQIPKGKVILDTHFPHLGQGMTALQERESEIFTIYDGKLPDPPPELNPESPFGPVVSANRLETIGKCPLSYWFKYVLNIEKPDYLVDASTWLDPLKFGTLLHEVFYAFMADLIQEGRRPLVERDRPKLLKILEEQVNRYKRMHPPPGQGVLVRQNRLLKQAALIFLTEEEILCRTNIPKFLEASIGMASDKVPGFLDQSQPLRVRLSPDRMVRVQGRIDRIDLLAHEAEEVFGIWDYKTGSAFRYQRPDPFQGGRMIQHALYMEMAALMLEAKVSPQAKVMHFGYFFPGIRSRGARIMRLSDLRSSGLSIIASLCQAVAEGCFIATDNYEEDCTFCDYKMICGDTKLIAQGVQKKLRNRQNLELETIRNLRTGT